MNFRKFLTEKLKSFEKALSENESCSQGDIEYLEFFQLNKYQ
jgi:hypothetical protein